MNIPINYNYFIEELKYVNIIEKERKQHFLQHKEKHKDTKEAYTDGDAIRR